MAILLHLWLYVQRYLLYRVYRWIAFSIVALANRSTPPVIVACLLAVVAFASGRLSPALAFPLLASLTLSNDMLAMVRASKLISNGNHNP